MVNIGTALEAVETALQRMKTDGQIPDVHFINDYSRRTLIAMVNVIFFDKESNFNKSDGDTDVGMAAFISGFVEGYKSCLGMAAKKW